MKVRVMKRYTPGTDSPYYSVDTWHKLFWRFGYWKTQIRTTSLDYASSAFVDYKLDNRKVGLPKDKCILIHYG